MVVISEKLESGKFLVVAVVAVVVVVVLALNGVLIFFTFSFWIGGQHGKSKTQQQTFKFYFGW
jgi:hypothetical protein